MATGRTALSPGSRACAIITTFAMRRAINADPQQAQREFDVHSIGFTASRYLPRFSRRFHETFQKLLNSGRIRARAALQVESPESRESSRAKNRALKRSRWFEYSRSKPATREVTRPAFGSHDHSASILNRIFTRCNYRLNGYRRPLTPTQDGVFAIIWSRKAKAHPPDWRA